MAEITITTDGTLNGTKLVVDGKEITKKDRVVNISFMASAPYKSQYSGEIYKGGVAVDYTTMDEKGTIQRQTLGTSDANYIRGIGEKIKQQDNVVRFVGHEVDADINGLVDKIVAHCAETKAYCPEKDKLLSRTKESLRDMASDLGVKIDG